MANKSVKAFRKLTLEMQRQVYVDAIAELEASADNLVRQMRAVVVHGPTSRLANSIRKQPGKTPTIVRVLAGGVSTTQPATSSGRPAYDYARAVEFGTQHNSAQPFFFPTFRLMRKQMRSAMRRKITARIKKYSAE
jgi:HK97 gp10 family phage protein